jgi:hypothetical protein
MMDGPFRHGGLDRSHGDVGIKRKIKHNPGFERLETELHGGEVVAQPDSARAKRRDADAALEQFVGDASLAPGGCSMAVPWSRTVSFWLTRANTGGWLRGSGRREGTPSYEVVC